MTSSQSDPKHPSSKSTSLRRPYRMEVDRKQWWQNRSLLFYLLREGTSLFMVWFALLLLYGLYQFQQHHGIVFIQLLQQPWVRVMNGLTLLAALLHSVTWFNLAPKAGQIIWRKKVVPAKVLTALLWGAWLLFSLVFILYFCWATK